MHAEDFYDLVAELAERLLPKVPRRYVPGIESAIHGGEYDIAAENLVYTIVDDRVPVTVDERDMLHRIVNEMPYESAALLPKLATLTVVEDGAVERAEKRGDATS